MECQTLEFFTLKQIQHLVLCRINWMEDYNGCDSQSSTLSVVLVLLQQGILAIIYICESIDVWMYRCMSIVLMSVCVCVCVPYTSIKLSF